MIERIEEKGFTFSINDEAKQYLIDEGNDEQYGARPLRRAVQQFVEDPLSELLLRGAFEPGAHIEVRVSSGETKGLYFEPGLSVAEGVTT